MSGRALRRLPVLALARYIGIGTSATTLALSAPAKTKPVKGGSSKSRTPSVPPDTTTKGLGADVAVWLDAMEKVVKDQASEHGKLP